MTALFVTPEKIDEVNRAVVEARAHVIPWETMRDVAVATPSNTLMLSERPPGVERRPASIGVQFVGGVTAAISFEEQPAGIIRHMSCSTGKPGNNHLPHPVMIAELCRLFGFREFPPTAGRIWVEEYKPNFFAVNIAELEVERTAGHA